MQCGKHPTTRIAKWSLYTPFNDIPFPHFSFAQWFAHRCVCFFVHAHKGFGHAKFHPRDHQHKHKLPPTQTSSTSVHTPTSSKNRGSLLTTIGSNPQCPPPILPTGADDELQNDEMQTDLPAEAADRSSYRDRQRHSRNAWTSRFLARHARPPT